MRMRDDEGGDASGLLPGEEGGHHSAAGVAAIAPGPRVHDHELSAGRSNDRRVTLAYIEKM